MKMANEYKSVSTTVLHIAKKCLGLKKKRMMTEQQEWLRYEVADTSYEREGEAYTVSLRCLRHGPNGKSPN